MNQEQILIEGVSNALVQEGVLSREDALALQKAFSETEVERFEEFLLAEDVVEKQDLLNALQHFYQLDAIDVVGMLFDHDMLRKFPLDVMVRVGFIPYQQDGDVLEVIAARPQDSELLDIIGSYVSYDIVFSVGLYRDICDAAKEFYDESVAVVHEDDIEEAAEEEAQEVVQEEE